MKSGLTIVEMAQQIERQSKLVFYIRTNAYKVYY